MCDSDPIHCIVYDQECIIFGVSLPIYGLNDITIVQGELTPELLCCASGSVDECGVCDSDPIHCIVYDQKCIIFGVS